MKVAVVGSGVSGLGATWLLNEYSDHEVHLYESDFKPGGHANTVHYLPKGKQWKEGVDVDVGFIVFNPVTYPNFLRFLQLYAPKSESSGSIFSSLISRILGSNTDDAADNKSDPGIRILPTEMTFSVSRDRGVFEWAGKNLATVFCQPRRLVDPKMWRMIYDVLRFNACARRILLTVEGDNEFEISIGDYLQREGYSDVFRDNYLIPMVAAIWSTPPDKCSLDFPARTLIQFMYNHHLIQITGRPSWLTIKGGSHNYVSRIVSQVPKGQLHLSTKVRSVQNIDQGGGIKPRVLLKTEDGTEAIYDHVILACHSDTALDILRRGGDFSKEEERILGQFEWNKNEAVLHHDEKLMPKSRLAWSCWNYLSFSKPVDKDLTDTDNKRQRASSRTEINQVSLSYLMNDLQHIPEARYGPVIVTLNPPFKPEVDKVFNRWQYDHPVIDAKAIHAQNEMHKIQNTRSISYAGAYLKYGFHEDGFTSGLLAACSVDGDLRTNLSTAESESSTSSLRNQKRTVRPPFDIRDADHHIALRRRGADALSWRIAAWMFCTLEDWGLTSILGAVGAVVLGVVGFFLGLREV
ncbi:FAD/NAD(P)-binding domain-containing protein [Agrocybe pediades]|nr:FAD/NAD(P)-binding domain-containing protein [Agrocybe pediades]